MSDWDGGRYHRLSDPQLGWGRAVLARLQPAAGERILDIGCGTGRLTTEMAARPGIVAIGLDRSPAMLAEAILAARGESLSASDRRCIPAGGVAPPANTPGILGRRALPAGRLAGLGATTDFHHGLPGAGSARYVRGDAAALPFAASFDAVFSTATFHWIPDHARLFCGIARVLRAGGRLVAQCGGGPNLARLRARARGLMDMPGCAAYFTSWIDPWHFAGVAETHERLARAGFVDVDVTLDPAPTAFDSAAAFADFISCVCVRQHLDRLPQAVGQSFVQSLTDGAAADDPPFTLDYWRLNIAARTRSA